MLYFYSFNHRTALYHCALAFNVRYWGSKQKGLAIGLPVAFHGLCGFIYSAIAWSFFMKLDGNGGKSLDVTQFVLFIAISVLVLNIAVH